MSYKHALRAKGIKPIRGATHTVKKPDDIELLPVRGVYVHGKRMDINQVLAGAAEALSSPFLDQLRSEPKTAEVFFGVPLKEVTK